MFWLKFLFFPILFPLSFLYGILAFLNRIFTFQRVQADAPVISVGNLVLGGAGKTPLVQLLAELLDHRGYSPVIISKSYKANARKPVEVFKDSLLLEVGDEPLLLKKLGPESLRVFSGPIKWKNLLFAQERTKDLKNKVYLIDDGAQHYKIKKDFKILAWNSKISYLNLLPFPLGWSREWWFLKDSVDLNVLQPARKTFLDKLLKEPILKTEYKARSFIKGEAFYNKSTFQDVGPNSLKGEFILISGIASFDRLLENVAKKSQEEGLVLSSYIKAKDHDSFNWFKAEKNKNYLCTSKDFDKLKHRVESDFLYVVDSTFDEDFIKNLTDHLKKLHHES